MTDIPGTQNLPDYQDSTSSGNDQKLTVNPKKNNTPEPVIVEEPITSINVDEMHRKKSEGPESPEDKLWFNQLKYWILFGSAGSLVIAIMAISSWRFLLLTPLGPVLGFFAWHIRKRFKKLDEKNKGFFR